MIIPAGLIAVVRAESMNECRTIAHGLIMAGVPTIELTMTSPDTLTILKEFASSDAVLGCGTVLDHDTCKACINAGARFIVSPVTDLAVLDAARRAGVPYVGGAATPCEVWESMRVGVDAVKLFPIGLLGGSKYLRTLREPFPALRAVVSGGIDPSDFGAYISAGAHAICIGGGVIDRPAARAGDVDSVAYHAQRVLLEIDKVKRITT